MYLQHQVALLIAAVTLVNAQDFSSVPNCAKSGTLQAITATACSTSDTACFCKSANFTSAFASSARTNCSDADYASAIAAARNICAQAGVSIFNTSSSSSMTASATTTTSGASSPSSAATTNTNDRTASAMNPTLSISVTTRCKCEEETITFTPTPPTTTPVASFTGAAARLLAGGGEGALAGVMAAAGLAALL